MTNQEPTPSIEFWQALEAYLVSRIVEQVAEKSVSEPTRVFYKDVKMVGGKPTQMETELEFMQWTPRFLMVKYPSNSVRAGRTWRMGRGLVNYWLKEKILRIEGDIPEEALIV